MNNTQDEIEIDLLEIFFLLKKRIWILLASGLVLGCATGLFTKFCIEPTYSSTAKLYILSTSTSLTSFADIQIGTSLTKDYVQLVQSRPVVEQVIKNLNLNRSYKEVLKQTTFENPTDTRILVITAEDPDPALAKDIADQFAVVSAERISSIMKTEEPSVVELGYISDRPVSPSMKKNVVIGVLLGIFIAAAIVFVLYMIDDTVKTSDDIEKYLNLNTLTVIPLKEGEEKSGKRKFRRRGKKKDGK